MPRPPRFFVLEKLESLDHGTPGCVARNGLVFPVICKPVEACGEFVSGSFSSPVVSHGIGHHPDLEKKNCGDTKA